jgi:hypothetical protein
MLPRIQSLDDIIRYKEKLLEVIDILLIDAVTQRKRSLQITNPAPHTLQNPHVAKLYTDRLNKIKALLLGLRPDVIQDENARSELTAIIWLQFMNLSEFYKSQEQIFNHVYELYPILDMDNPDIQAKLEQKWKKEQEYRAHYKREIDESQLGKYFSSTAEQDNAKRIKSILKDTTTDPLYAGIENYKKGYRDKVKEYRIKYGFPLVDDINPENRTYFREQFIQLLKDVQKNPLRYSKDPKLRETSPEQANIDLMSLLGKRGAELYQLALEEEMNTKEYMDALLNKSTREYKGAKWQERPFIIMGGPSGCGKSTSSEDAVSQTMDFLETEDGSEDHTNYVISVDGGDAREISQMRKLAIKVAISKGYTGISDLHNKSNILESAKERVLNYCLQSDTPHGVVLPETFSKFPAGKTKMLLDKIARLPKTKPVFCMVVGKNPSIFQKVVAFMGSRRAWKTNWKKNQHVNFDMNSKEDLPESKAYNARGFLFGENGSRAARLYFQILLGGRYIGMEVINDLVLKKQDTNGNWIDASQDDPGAIKISERVFLRWLDSDRKKTLEEFRDSPEQKLPAIIYTSNTFKALKALNVQHQIEKQIKSLMKNKSSQNAIELKLLYELSGKMKKLNFSDPAGRDEINNLVVRLNVIINDPESTYSKSTQKLISSVIKTLQAIHIELEQRQQKIKSREGIDAPGNVSEIPLHPITNPDTSTSTQQPRLRATTSSTALLNAKISGLKHHHSEPVLPSQKQKPEPDTREKMTTTKKPPDVPARPQWLLELNRQHQEKKKSKENKDTSSDDRDMTYKSS